MRIRPESGPPPWLNRRDQYRMLMMLGVLMFVVVAIRVASQEATWHWMFPEEQTATDSPAALRPGDEREPDFRVRLESELAPDEFVSPPTAVRPQAASREEALSRVTPPEQEPNGPLHPRDALRVDPQLLASVEDNRLGVRREEAPAFHAVLSQAANTPPEQLEQATAETTGFRVLMVDAAYYRGRPVAIAGMLRRLLPFQAGQNEFDLSQLYEAWITPVDSPTRLVRVVFTRQNEQLPTGEDLEFPVRAAGFFFKLEGYAARGGMTTAPLILAPTLEAFPGLGRITGAGGPPPVDTSLVNWLVAMMVLIAGSLGMMVWRFRSGDRQFRRTVYQRVLDAPEGAIDALAGVETQTAAEFFQQFGDQSEESDS